MKVAIFDLVHLDWIVPYSELLQNEPIDVYFYVSADFRKDLEASEYYRSSNFFWHFVEPVQGALPFLKGLHSFLCQVKPDLVILNSVDGKHLFVYLALLRARVKRVVINIHSINTDLNPTLSTSIKTSIRAISKRILNANAEGYIVNAEAMKAYITRNGLTSKPVFVLSPVYYKEALARATDSEEIAITIPGSIDSRRRDYHLALKAFSECAAKNKQARLILAGRPVEHYGNEILDAAKELVRNGRKIQFYTEEVPEKEFQAIVSSSTLIFSPLVATTVIHDQTEERYGSTKTSGNIYDAIRYGKPLVLPDHVGVPDEIRSSCIFYSSLEDLCSKLTNLLSEDECLNKYTLQAKDNSSAFSKQKMRDRLLNIIRREKQ